LVVQPLLASLKLNGVFYKFEQFKEEKEHPNLWGCSRLFTEGLFIA